MSEEIALAAADLKTVEQLRARVLEWEDAYDRLAGAFDLHMDILACRQAMSDYAGVFFDVVLGEQADRADQFEQALSVAMQENDGWRTLATIHYQKADTLESQLGQAHAEIARLTEALNTKEQKRMNITQITVSYGETQSLPEYSNVKPNITITATIEEGDDPTAAEVSLWAHAKQQVHEQIDLALEANDKAAKYSTEPRFQVLRTYWNEWEHRGQPKPPQYVVIVPNEANFNRGAYAQRLVHFARGDSRKLRYEHALRIAEGAVADRDDGPYTLIDCADGDLSRLDAALPPLPEEKPAKRADESGRSDHEDYFDERLEDDEDEEDEDEEARDFVAEAHERIAHKNDDEQPDHLA